MSVSTGCNPMRWQCESSGCYNVKHRPKIEIFAESLPGRIAFTDVDATVEVNGHFLFLEFKSGSPRPLPVGQKIYFCRLTSLSPAIIVAVVCADAETMDVRALSIIRRGIIGPWEISTTNSLQSRIKDWAKSVTRKPLVVSGNSPEIRLGTPAVASEAPRGNSSLDFRAGRKASPVFSGRDLSV